MDRSVASNLALIGNNPRLYDGYLFTYLTSVLEENKRKSRWGNTTGSNASLTHSLSSGSLPVSRPTPVSSTEKLKSAEKERHGSAEKTFGYKKPKVVL